MKKLPHHQGRVYLFIALYVILILKVGLPAILALYANPTPHFPLLAAPAITPAQLLP